MNERFEPGSLELEVSNFGPIVEAKIDLRPLTVFIGPSNTGKSYLAILIYALHRYFSGGRWPGRRRFFRDSLMSPRTEVNKLSGKAIYDFAELAVRMLTEKRESLPKEGIVLPGSITDVICAGFGEQGGYLGNEIGRCFGIKEAGELIRKATRDSANVVFRRRISNDLAPINHRLTISAHEHRFETKVPGGTPVRIDVGDDHFDRMATRMFSLIDEEEGERPSLSAWGVLDALTDHVRSQIVGPLDLPAFYLPADRTGVMHAHSVVVSALIGSAPMTGLRPAARTPMLSGVLADFLEQLISLDRPPYRRRSPRRDLGTRIEDAILGGSIGVERSEAIGYPHFTYRPEGWKDSLSLMNASSMVSELAPVVLYLRHMVGPGNVLIVEEPESHLHPAMQVEFTRQLAALVHAGIRVIVTTHSEWVLEELANIVRRSELPVAERKKTASGEFALEPDQVGAWLFQPKGRPKGSVVKEIRLDDSGLFPCGFDDVAAALHNDWADLASRIGKAE